MNFLRFDETPGLRHGQLFRLRELEQAGEGGAAGRVPGGAAALGEVGRVGRAGAVQGLPLLLQVPLPVHPPLALLTQHCNTGSAGNRAGYSLSG